MDTELGYMIGFSHCMGIGPVRFDRLLERFGTVEAAYTAPIGDIQDCIGAGTGASFDRFRSSFSAYQVINAIRAKGITILSRFDKRFPQSLRELSDCPICIYIRGDVLMLAKTHDPSLAIVGTRSPTGYGMYIARLFSRELAKAGCCIVSGMALGIDGIAHQACLDAGGKTIAVLGCGVDICYPVSHRELYNRIIARGGAVISEFPPGRMVRRGFFIARNRLIAGLSQGVLVAEGAKDSGSLTTARYAAAQGKDVFAPPAPITSSLSEAPNILLKQGAQLVTEPSDIAQAFGIGMLPFYKNEAEIKTLSASERDIIGLLKKQVYSADELSNYLKKTAESLSSTLSVLEIRGIIQKNSEEQFELINRS